MNDIMLIFDLDGTLWDSGPEVAQSWNEVVEKRCPGRPPFTSGDIRKIMGRPMNEFAAILMPDLDPDFRESVFDECMARENEYITAHGGKLFPNVRETLETFVKNGYKLSIVSNCQEGYIKAFLVSMDMGGYFCDYEEWGRTGLSKGENIRLVMERNSVERAVYIGDTAGDESAAGQARIPFIHAAYGFGQAVSPTASAFSFPELTQALLKAGI